MMTPMSNQQRKETNDKEKTQQANNDAAFIEMLELLMQKAEAIHKELGDLIGVMDRVCIEKKAAGNPSWDFLVKDKRPANNEG